MTADAPAEGVIHDIGYRPYDGPRYGERSVAWWLYLAGLRNVFGFGRSAKSKVMPALLMAANLLPALIIVAVMVALSSDEPIIDYAAYPTVTQILPSIFAASQAPVLFSRDLRFGSIVLYLARPLSSTTYALARWAALATAMAIFLVAPLVVLAIGALLAGFEVGQTLREAGEAIALSILLAAMIASLAGVAAAISIRRGFAIVATLGILFFGSLVVAFVQSIAYSEGAESTGVVAGVFNPYSLFGGLAEGLFGIDELVPTAPQSTAAKVAYLGVAALVILAGIGLLLRRYRRVAGR